MSWKKTGGLESVLGRLDDLDEVNLQILVQRLVRDRRLLETVFNTIREGILVISSRGIINYSNMAASQMLGFSEREVGKMNLWKQVPDLARTVKFSPEGYLIERFGISREIDISYPDRRSLRLYILPVQSDDDQHDLPKGQSFESSRQYAIILSDITEEKASTQEKIESERVQSILQLAAGVAHELGNPLNSLTIHLQLMERQLKKIERNPDLEKLKKSLGICSSEVSRLDSIISHFLEAVRPQQPDFQDVDLIQVLEETLEVLAPEMEGAGLTVNVEVEGPLPLVLADKNQLKQVYFNIIKNAREAMEEGGIIKIRSRSDDEFCYIAIGDTGKGINQTNLSKVFQPYFTSKKGGSGLGMMVVQRIMRAHGGNIGIDSEEHVGTVVTLQFPQKHRRIRMLEHH